ncbi:hypothetical protein OSK93_23600, partial [Escherichia coli]|nr:hypothetical protein [Escherichia coli]
QDVHRFPRRRQINESPEGRSRVVVAQILVCLLGLPSTRCPRFDPNHDRGCTWTLYPHCSPPGGHYTLTVRTPGAELQEKPINSLICNAGL